MAYLGCLVGFMAETLTVCTEISLKLVVSRANIHWHLGHRTRGKFPVDFVGFAFPDQGVNVFPLQCGHGAFSDYKLVNDFVGFVLRCFLQKYTFH